MTTPSSSAQPKSTVEPTPLVQTRVTDYLANFPWWGLVLALMGVFLVFSFATDSTYRESFAFMISGIKLTIIVTVIAFILSMIIGLLTVFALMSKGKNILSVFVRNVATFYVQIVRGMPVIVLIFYVALVIIPAVIVMLNNFGDWMASMGWLSAENRFTSLTIRDFSLTARGIMALAINYGAFSAEVFRSGIQSIEKGQLEASRALGLNWFKMMRYVVLPQAIRRILPPLGNDLISMLKESSLVGVLGVQEIWQMGKKYTGSTFLFAETYNTVAFLYLSMTLVLSMGVKYMEQRMAAGEEQ